jgi:hypothetical protein
MRVGQARKRDANEPLIVETLRKMGILVTRASIPGFPDLICWHPQQARLVLLEVKSQKGTLTKAQQQHTAEGWPVTVVRSVTEAMELFGQGGSAAR